MKQIRTFARISLLALVFALAGTLLLTGCVTTEGGNTGASDYSGYQHSHH